MDSGSFREVLKTVHVSYPIPFVFTCLLAFGFFGFSGAFFSSGWLQVVLAGFGGLSSCIAFLIILYGVFLRPNLLRSERFEIAMRGFDILGDDHFNPQEKEFAFRQISNYLKYIPKPADSDDKSDEKHTGDGEANG